MITVAEAIRRPHDNFTLLRLALAVAVVVSHAASVGTGRHSDEPLYALTGYTLGEHGVNGFFAVSGFLVAMSWERRGGALPFAMARILRVYPGLIAATMVTAMLIGGAMTTMAVGGYLTAPATWKVIWQTVSIFKSASILPGVFEGNPLRWPMSTVWTLRYELICYGGLLVYGMLGGFRKPWIALAGAAGAASAIVVLGLMGPIPKGPETSLRLPLIFACGTLVWLYRDRVPVSLGVVAAILVVLPISALVLPALYKPALFIGSAYVFLWIAMAPGLAHPALEPPGDISYGVYLYGWPVQQTLKALFPAVSGWTMLPVAIALTCLIAALSWIAVEKPALRLKTRFMPARTT
jgi:peptidoglycan/LPS O-acetylase OafA/YrhL